VIATLNGSFPWRETEAGREIADLRRRLLAGEACGDALRLAQDRATREAIEAQARAGLDLVTDGLVRWEDPVAGLVARLAGLERGEDRVGFPGSGAPYAAPIASGEVAWREPILSEDFLFARQGSPRPVKVVLTGPFTIARLAEDRAYGDPAALAMGLASALNQELRSLQAAGCGFIQVNEPALLEARDEFPVFTRLWEVLGRGVTVTLCLHLAGAGLDGLYPAVTRLKRLGCLSVDGVSGLAGLGRMGAAQFPEGLQLGLGLVDGRSATVEEGRSLAETVKSLPGLPPPDRILLGTVGDLGELSPEVASAKLQSLAGAARLLEGR